MAWLVGWPTVWVPQALLLLVSGSTGPVAIGVRVHRPCCYLCPSLQALLLLVSGSTGPDAIDVWVYRPCWCLGPQALLLLVSKSAGPVAIGVWVHRPWCYWCLGLQALLVSGSTGLAIGVRVYRPCCYWCVGPQALLLLVCGSTGPVAIGVWVHMPCCYLCLLVVSESYATDTQWHGSHFLQTVLLSNSQLAPHTTCIVHLFCNHLLVTAHGQDCVWADF